jgi:DNA segregation ATPase FtsK/SpoIIIE-like protein
LNRTPPTHEKPHFDAYEIEYSDNGEYAENYAGSGYFRNVNGEDVPFNRQMGIWGPNGMRRFHLYNRIALLERSRNGEDIDFLRPIQLRLAADGTPFDISIDLTEEKNHARFIENESDELFLFEESLQNEKRELRLAKLRQYEAELRQIKENEELFQRRRQQQQEKQEQEKKMMQFKNRASQQKIEKQNKEKELFEIQMARWSNFNASAYIDHPATIEMAQKFSAPLEPFVYRNIPIPVALPHEYRNPVPIINEDDDDE